MIHVYTSAALNYLPKVRLLCQSIKKFHPDWVVHFALADKKPEWLVLSAEPFDDIIGLDELPIPNIKSWMFSHNLIELSTAIKPFVLQKLLETPEATGVIYLDPDIVVFSSLSDLEDKLKTFDILLTPHLTKEEKTLDAIRDNEICALRHGIYNLGFVAVKPSIEGKHFARWWGERLYHFCVSDWSQGLWTDQRWIDLVPAFFEGVCILKSSRYNVAPWNLSTRVITGSFETGFKVDGENLGFYHFTGFDSGAHLIMSTKYAPNNASVESLVSWYQTEVVKGAKQLDTNLCAWRFAHFDNGNKIEPIHRKIYRDRIDLQKAFPNPYSSNDSSYYYWLNTQGKQEYAELNQPSSESHPSLLLEPHSKTSYPFKAVIKRFIFSTVKPIAKYMIPSFARRYLKRILFS